MRILFFTHYFPPEANAPANRVYELCKRWVKNGDEVHVITGVPNVPTGTVYEGYKNRLVQAEAMDGIQTTRIWTYLAANRGKIKRILNYVSYMFSASIAGMFVPKPDIIIATSPQFFCGWAGVFTSRARRVPFILEVRDLWPDSIIAVGALRNKLLLRILKWLEGKMYAAAREIVTVGEGYEEELIRKEVQAAKISIVPNGIDREVFYPRYPEEKIREECGLSHEFVCSYVGTIGMASGLEVVLRTARLLKDRQRHNIKFLLVGAGAVVDELEHEAHRQNLDNIVFLGRKDRRLIPGILSISNACLVHLKKAQIFETVLPSKIFEAAAMAKPIICGVEGHAADLVRRTNAGICIEPENAEQLFSALVKLADNPKLCDTLGQAGHEYVMEHHDRDVIAKDYQNVIIRTCNRTRAHYERTVRV
ncbi:glycosyltransferase family 4 protein [Planctomycetota bacterium]